MVSQDKIIFMYEVAMDRDLEVEARKAKLLVEIRELLSASAKQPDSSVGKVSPFVLIDSHRERTAECLKMLHQPRQR